jgi:hypothetical protein
MAFVRVKMIPECYRNEVIEVEIFVKKGEELWLPLVNDSRQSVKVSFCDSCFGFEDKRILPRSECDAMRLIIYI